MIKIGDEFILHSKNGRDYYIRVSNINTYREPSMQYAIDVVEQNGTTSDDVIFVGKEFFSLCSRLK